MEGCPALLACVGVQRQAIPGLTLDASASCLASRQTGASQSPTQAVMLGAVTGGRSKAKHSNIKSQASLFLAPSPHECGERARVRGTGRGAHHDDRGFRFRGNDERLLMLLCF